MTTQSATMVSDEISRFSIEKIALLARRRGGSEMWLDVQGRRSWFEFGAAVEAARRVCAAAGVTAGSVVVTPGEAAFESLAWLFGVGAMGAVAAPLRHERWSDVESWKEFCEIGWRVERDRIVRVGEGRISTTSARLLSQLRARDHPGLILATGGTTGTQKLVLHDLAALLGNAIVSDEGRAWRTLPLMRFDHIGGLDMAWRALAGRQVLTAPPAELTPDSVAATIERHRVEVLPATPSFLNLLLLSGAGLTYDLSSLRVVPYGAEPMPERLLERLRAALPEVQFVQRFGTSETGAMPVVDADGGLFMREDHAGFAWKIVEGELWLRSPSLALGYLAGNNNVFDADGWFHTGDLAERGPNGKVRVLGRKHELINVGGEKILPAEIERVLLCHPLVADCRVGPLANVVLGQVVSAEIVWRGSETDPVVVKKLIWEFASPMLARYKLPAVVRLVQSIASTVNLKRSRAVVA